jgi:tetratricopeptide (TPR) repeat protein
MDSLQHWLNLFILNPKDSEVNFNLAYEYDLQGQTASAAGYYLRSIEFGNDNNRIYEALLRIALCFEKQGNRVFTIKGILLRAISLLPKRPEAYFLLSRTYERNKDWQESYTMAIIGYTLATDEPNTTTDVEYPNRWVFLFEQAVSGWWIGLHDESIRLFKTLFMDYKLTPLYRTAVMNNLDNLDK